MEKISKLPGKVKSMLMHVLTLFFLFSCSKDLQEPASLVENSLSEVPTAMYANALSENLVSGNFLYHETFEGSSAFRGLNTQFETSHAFSMVTDPVFQASKAGRFELRSTDPENNNGVRAEVVFPVATNLNRWYSFAVYFPSADFKRDTEDELIGQWKQHERGTSSAISLRIKDDRFRLSVIPSYKATSEKIDLGPVTKDKWLTFVFHIKHSTGSDGVLELWLNGKKVLSRAGSNMYKLSAQIGMTNPEWKLGIYKSAWNGTQTTSTSKRVLFYDDIRLGNENATLSEMTPVPNGAVAPTDPIATEPTPTNPTPTDSTPTEPTPTEPTPTVPTTPTAPTTPTVVSPISSLTLVSAHTEKDIQTISEGTAISLGTIPVAKLNIRANIAGGYKSVKFELSGTTRRTYLDSNLPFSLMGDDGASNYYFTTWNPPILGNYTLTATPYSGAKGTGTAGIPYTVNFSFVK
jgi:hypothetical protein